MAIKCAPPSRVGSLILLLGICRQISAAINPEWCTKQCDCNPQYKNVDCTRKLLSQVPLMSNLTVNLYMDYNNIGHIEDTDFDNLDNLVVLSMQNNVLMGVGVDSFCGLQKLELLNLNQNKLSLFEIPTNTSVECRLPQLKKLLLSQNSLTEMPNYLAEYTPSLEILNMSFNELNSVSFDGNLTSLPQSLRFLDLRGNHIHYIRADDFIGLKLIPLTSLSLSENSLIDIAEEAFQGLTELTTLSLSRNNGLPKSVLQRVFNALGNNSHLCELELFEMVIPTINASLFSMFKNLTKLDLYGCMADRVDPELFNQLTKLENLDLGDNSLSRLDNLNALKKLRWLRLNANNLTSIDFSELDNLKVIDLSQNRFHVVPAAWMSPNVSLHLLNFSNNLLTYIHPEAFQNNVMQILDLSRNRMTSLPDTKLQSLYKLDMSYNFLSTVNLEVLGQTAWILRELDFRHNNISSFRGDPDKYKEFSSIQDLNLGFNRLGPALQDGKLAGVFRRMSHLLNLNLPNNFIHDIAPGQFKYLHHVTTLDLSHNDISGLGSLSLTEVSTVSKLLLANNNIQVVEPSVLNDLQLLQEVDLSYNPYNCTPCEVLPFLKWLNTTLLIILGEENPAKYQCLYPSDLQDSSLRSYNPLASVTEEDCVHQNQPRYFHTKLDWVMIGIAIAGALVFVTLAVVLFSFSQMCHKIKSLHYRWQIRYREVSGVEFHSDLKA